jgi:hypothetical protein
MTSQTKASLVRNYGLVICHRWFVSGEGWAWADGWKETDLQEALGLLKADLGSLRRPGQRAFHQLRRGILVAHSIEDLDCPDPLARPRHPVLITGVFIAGARRKDCSPSDEDLLLGEADRACRKLDSSGCKSELSLALPAGMANVRRRRNIVKIMCLFAVAAIACGVGGEALKEAVKGTAATFGFAQEGGEKNIQPWALAVRGPLQRWGIQDLAPQAASVDGNTQAQAVNAFLALLARQQDWGRLDDRHVDLEFLRRLPELPAKVERSPKEAAVRGVMLDLLKDFSPIESEKMEEQTPEEIIAAIARNMDYRAWYAGETRQVLFDGRSMPCGDREREYVLRFCVPAVGIEDGGLTQVLHEIMVSQWGVNGLTGEDLRRRPWFVVGCFFEFVAANAAVDPVALRNPRAEEAGPQRNSAAVLERLRKHLPAESVVSRGRLREDNLERVIRDGLRVLAMNLDIPTSGRDDRSLLEDVRARLKQVAESTLEAVPEGDMATSTRWYLEHLACRIQTPQKGTSAK